MVGPYGARVRSGQPTGGARSRDDRLGRPRFVTGDSTAAEAPRQLGRLPLRVTRIGIGCAEIGSMAETFGFDVPEEQALAVVRAALDSPIRFLDTAAAYGDGESER